MLSCYNSYQDAGEAGVDCGGACVAQCPSKVTIPGHTNFGPGAIAGVVIGSIALVAISVGYWMFIRRRGLPSTASTPRTTSRNKVVPEIGAQTVAASTHRGGDGTNGTGTLSATQSRRNTGTDDEGLDASYDPNGSIDDVRAPEVATAVSTTAATQRIEVAARAAEQDAALGEIEGTVGIVASDDADEQVRALLAAAATTDEPAMPAASTTPASEVSFTPGLSTEDCPNLSAVPSPMLPDGNTDRRSTELPSQEGTFVRVRQPSRKSVVGTSMGLVEDEVPQVRAHMHTHVWGFS